METGAEGFVIGGLFDHALSRLELFLHGGFKLLQVLNAGLAGFAFLKKAGRIDHGDFAGGAAGRRKYEHEAQSDSADSTHGNSIRKEVQRRRNPATGVLSHRKGSVQMIILPFFPTSHNPQQKTGSRGDPVGFPAWRKNSLRRKRAISPSWKNARAT